jgi:excisionase family DNA binding protein
MNPQGLLSVKEVSSYLGVSPSTVYRLAENREIPFIKRSGLGVRFCQKSVGEWLEKSTHREAEKRLNYIINQQYNLTLPPSNCIFSIDGKYKEGGKGEMAKHAKSKSRYNFGFGAIYSRKTVRGNQRWYLDYYSKSGKRVQEVVKHAGCKEDALIALRTKAQSILRGQTGEDGGDPGFKEFSEEYLREYAVKRKRSWRSDQCYLRGHLVPFFGNMRLSEITRQNVEQYSSRRVEEGVKKSTVNRELAVLRKMMFKAIDWGRLDQNPVQKEDFFQGEEQSKERVLTPDEQIRLLQASAASLKPILITALNTGMRRGEILGLEWERVDLKNRKITLACTNTKNKKRREIPINEELFSLLATLRAGANGSQYVFPNPFTGRPLLDAKCAFYRACKRAGIKGLRFHDLRHTFASRLSARGVDLNTIRELLGHGSIRMTQRYLHSNQALKRNAVESLVDRAEESGSEGAGLLHGRDIPAPVQRVSPVTDSISTN